MILLKRFLKKKEEKEITSADLANLLNEDNKNSN
jgi:hypothetical protein